MRGTRPYSSLSSASSSFRSRLIRFWWIAPIVLVAIGLTASQLGAAPSAWSPVWDTPEARIFDDDYAGAPVVGDTMTRLPALAPLAKGQRTHHVRLDIVASEIEVAPGVRYAAWTFGGSVPGPVLHVREGDRVVFTMKNRSAEHVVVTDPEAGQAPFLADSAANALQRPTRIVAPMHHSIDFHAGTVAPNDKWRMVMPGQSITFEWVANYPGVFLYHCGVPPILLHMAMGQYGAVVVSPRDGYPTDAEVDREYVILQSEFFLTPGEGDEALHVLDFERAAGKRPTHVLFNGHQSSMVTTPLHAVEGERVRLYLHNVGPSDTSSFHVVGTIFDRVFYEGNPRNEWFGMQTVLLGASNGAVVEFIAPEPGDYIMVDHEFADAQLGAVGYIKVVGRDGAAPVLPAMAH